MLSVYKDRIPALMSLLSDLRGEEAANSLQIAYADWFLAACN